MCRENESFDNYHSFLLSGAHITGMVIKSLQFVLHEIVARYSHILLV